MNNIVDDENLREADPDGMSTFLAGSNSGEGESNLGKLQRQVKENVNKKKKEEKHQKKKEEERKGGRRGKEGRE